MHTDYTPVRAAAGNTPLASTTTRTPGDGPSVPDNDK
jgi:hypothetical protein